MLYVPDATDRIIDLSFDAINLRVESFAKGLSFTDNALFDASFGK